MCYLTANIFTVYIANIFCRSAQVHVTNKFNFSNNDVSFVPMTHFIHHSYISVPTANSFSVYGIDVEPQLYVNKHWFTLKQKTFTIISLQVSAKNRDKKSAKHLAMIKKSYLVVLASLALGGFAWLKSARIIWPVPSFNITNVFNIINIINFTETRKGFRSYSEILTRRSVSHTRIVSSFLRFHETPPAHRETLWCSSPENHRRIGINSPLPCGSYSDTRDFAIAHASPAQLRDARESLQLSFQLCGRKWLIFSLVATTTVSDTPFMVDSVRVAGGRFRTAYTTLTRTESFANVARGALWRFLLPRAGQMYNPEKLIWLGKFTFRLSSAWGFVIFEERQMQSVRVHRCSLLLTLKRPEMFHKTLSRIETGTFVPFLGGNVDIFLWY